MADNEQRRALASTVPTTDVIRDAVTFPRDRLGEPLDISGDRFDAWLARVRRDAALHEKQRIAGEVRLWASINHDRANEDMGDLLDLVAGDIDRIHEETP